MRSGLRWAVGVLATAVAVGVLAIAGWAGDPDFDLPTASLAPDPVTGGEDALYTVRFSYHPSNHQTLTHTRVIVEVPPDWTLPPQESGPAAAPDTCVLVGSRLTCEHGSIRPGSVVTQEIRVRTAAVASASTRVVTSRLTFDERDADGEPGPGRVDSISAPDATVQVVPPSATRSSECVPAVGGEVSTTATRVVPMKVSAVIPATSQLCSPTSLEARPADDPVVVACPVGVHCTTPIAVTSTPQFTTGTPTTLTFQVQAKGFTTKSPWYKDGQLPAVPRCTGAPGVASPDPCIASQTKTGKTITIVVLSSGNDPGWQG